MPEAERKEAREIDPTDYLTGQGFEVVKRGRHLSARLHGDEAYRLTNTDGRWLWCDRYGNNGGDNIDLVKELEPGTGYADAVYRLAGAPSVAAALRPAPAPVQQPAPTMPMQTPEDVDRGREYLSSRGISLETVMEAEASGMLRYSGGGVLFVGRDDGGKEMNVTRRSINESDPVPKRDLRGTDKRHPQVIHGAIDTVLIVEGGADALAAVDIAKRERRPWPTVLISGGANTRSWMQTPWVQRVLKAAKRVIVAFDRETKAEVQVETDAAHELQMQKLREVCTAEVTGWKPPPGIKDMAALNEHQVQEIRVAAEAQRAARPAITYPSRYSTPTPTATAYPVPGRRG